MRVSLLLLLLSFLPLAHAQQPTPGGPPKTLVLFASDLTWDDLRPNGDLLPLRRLASEGGCALLNTTVAGEPTEAAAFLTVGAGARIAAPSAQGPRIQMDGVELTVADIAQEAYPANAWEGNAVRPVYVRRFGVPVPAGAVGVDIGLPLLQRVQPGPVSAAQMGALGDALRQAGRRVAVFGDWRATVAGMDRQGVVYHGSAVLDLTPARLPAALQEADVILATAGTGRRPLRLLCDAVLPLVQRGAINLVVTCPSPPLDAAHGRWQRLGFVIGAGPAFRQHSLLTSATTHTDGLAANIDLAPAILALQGLPPFSGGAGHPLRSVPAGRLPALDAVTRLDSQVNLTEDASVPVLAGYGALAVAACFAALLLCFRARGQSSAAPVPGAGAAGLALRLAAAGPLAFLPVGVLAPAHVWQFGAVVAACCLIFALTADLLGGWLEVSPLGLLFLGTAVAVGADALFGSPLVSHALLSGYYLPGLRFYGVGNEYMTLTIGAALAGTALLAPRALMPAGLVTALLLGLPWFGANVGGALAATAVFLLTALLLRTGERRARHVAASFGAALLVAALCLFTDRLLPAGGAGTHLGGALREGSSGALGEMVARKMARSVHVARSGWTLAALAGFVPLALLLVRGGVPLRERVERTLMRDYALAAALPAALWGALAVLLFTDSGVAAALLLLAPPGVAVIHQMLEEG